MTSPRRAPVSRRQRPAKPALSRAGIVAAAVAILRADGLDRLTMRRLAQELDTGPASLYVYVADTAELHAAVLDELLGEIDLGQIDRGQIDRGQIDRGQIDRGRAAGPAGWRERLHALVGSYHTVLFAQPGLARVALVTRLSGPHYLAVVDAALGLLLEGGLPPYSAGLAMDQLFLMATASAVEHGTRAATPGAERQHDALVAAVDAASPARYPHIATLGRALVDGTGADRARWAFDVLLNGALATPGPRSGQTDRAVPP